MSNEKPDPREWRARLSTVPKTATRPETVLTAQAALAIVEAIDALADRLAATPERATEPVGDMVAVSREDLRKVCEAMQDAAVANAALPAPTYGQRRAVLDEIREEGR